MSAEIRSEWATLAAALAAPLLLWCCGVSWLWVLLGGLAAVGVYALLCRLQPEKDLAALTRSAFGGKIGTAVLWLQALGLALGAGYLLRSTDPIVPNLTRGYPWIPIVLCALALAGAWRGRKAALASGAVLFWLTTATVAVVAVFSLPQIRGDWLLPVGMPGQMLPALAVFLLPVLPLYCRRPEGQRSSVRLHLLVVLAAAAVVFITSACLSPRLAAQEPLPFFTLAATCRLLGHAARFDAVFCMSVSAAIYCMLILMLNYCHALTAGEKRWPMVVFILAALAASWLAPDEPSILMTTYLVAIWIAVPLYCVLFCRGKKCEKSEKSC